MQIDMGSGVPPGNRTKLVFVVWAPATATIKQKMVTASSKDALKKKLDGFQVPFYFTNPGLLLVLGVDCDQLLTFSNYFWRRKTGPRILSRTKFYPTIFSSFEKIGNKHLSLIHI